MNLDFLEANNFEIKSKNFLRLSLIIFVIFLIITMFFGIRFLSKMSDYNNYTRTIDVSGKGEVKAVPDLAEINFTLKEMNDSKDKSKNIELQNNIVQQMKKIIQEFEDLKISKKDIQTENYSVQPKYTYQNCYSRPQNYMKPCDSNVLTGYEISQTVIVKVRQTELTGKVLAILAENNITTVSGPNFTIEDKEKLKRQARDLAIQDAKQKAKDLSEVLDVEIEDIVSFNDGENNFIPSQYGSANHNKSMPLSMTPFGLEMSAPVVEGAVITEGEDKIIAKVIITFELED